MIYLWELLNTDVLMWFLIANIKSWLTFNSKWTCISIALVQYDRSKRFTTLPGCQLLISSNSCSVSCSSILWQAARHLNQLPSNNWMTCSTPWTTADHCLCSLCFFWIPVRDGTIKYLSLGFQDNQSSNGAIHMTWCPLHITGITANYAVSQLAQLAVELAVWIGSSKLGMLTSVCISAT